MFSRFFGRKKTQPEPDATALPAAPLVEPAPQPAPEPISPAIHAAILEPIAVPAPEPEPEPEVAQSGFFARMKQAVARTRDSLTDKLEGVLAMSRTVDEAMLEDLESALLTSDLGLPTTTAILTDLRERAKRQSIQGGDELRSLLKQQLRAILEAPDRPIVEPDTPPRVIFMVGVNGTGKTTTAASSPPGSRPAANPSSSAPQTPSAPPPLSSFRSGPPAPASP